ELHSLKISECENLVSVKKLVMCKKLETLDCSESGNIRDFYELVNVPNLKFARWTEKATASYIVMASANRRADVDFIKDNISIWAKHITLAKNPQEYAEELLKSAGLLGNIEISARIDELIENRLSLD
ncbi:MAG: hypothetical protein PHR06_08270, partial [Candidatus Cloacimonetes bacterium]|nr:hypothetical protein [Candidatus Cloacimonadota bacterium]